MRYAERLVDILERIDRIRRATADGRTAFFESDVLQDAVIRNLEVIGDAAKQFSAPTRRLYPKVPWREMSRFPDLAIHHYGRILDDEAWSIVEKDLGRIRRTIQAGDAARSR